MEKVHFILSGIDYTSCIIYLCKFTKKALHMINDSPKVRIYNKKKKINYKLILNATIYLCFTQKSHYKKIYFKNHSR